MDSTIGIEEIQAVAISYAFPNPLKDQTIFLIQLEARHHLRIEILDPDGRLLANVKEGEFDRGEYHIPFDGRNLSSGSKFPARLNSRSGGKV
jgi:hypothetical protein